jgi:branched-chain amino acid transport system substrate-binding protein
MRPQGLPGVAHGSSVLTRAVTLASPSAAARPGRILAIRTTPEIDVSPATPALSRRTVALAALLAIAACGRGGTIKIGLAGPFTDPVGAPMKLAAEMAVDEINAGGGIGGRKLVLVERDDSGDPDSAVAAAVALEGAGVVAVVGDVFSGTTLAAAPVYNGARHPVVQLSPSSSSPEVTAAGPYTFRICPSDLAHGAALARYAREQLRFSRGAVLYLNDEYGRGIRQTFVSDFVRQGGTVVESDPYLGSTPDVGPYIQRLSEQGSAQFLLVAGNRSEGEEILRRARAQGLRAPVMGGDGLEGIEEAGALAEGTYVTAAYMAVMGSPRNRKFVAAYARRYPTAGAPNQPAAATYDAIHLLAEVIRRTGTDRKAIRDGLAAVGTASPAFEGVTGTIAFDLNGDVPRQPVIVGVVRNGKVVVAEGQQ